MRSLFIAAALAVGGTAGLAGTASAQYYGYNYRTYANPVTGGVVSGQTVITPYGAQTATGFYNPLFGSTGQSYGYADVFGNQYRTTAGYNPYVGAYSTGFGYTNPYLFNPNPYLTSGNLSMYNAALINQQRYNTYMNNLYRGRR